MTTQRYRFTVNGLIGPTLKQVLSEFDTEEFARHHILLVADNSQHTLFSVLDLLAEHGIEVEQVTARYR